MNLKTIRIGMLTFNPQKLKHSVVFNQKIFRLKIKKRRFRKITQNLSFKILKNLQIFFKSLKKFQKGAENS